MRKSGADVMPKPREVNYSTSGSAVGGRAAKEYEQSSLMKITRTGWAGSTMTRGTTRQENPRGSRRQQRHGGRDEKLLADDVSCRSLN